VTGLLLVPFEIMISQTIFQFVGLVGFINSNDDRFGDYIAELYQAIQRFLVEENIDGVITHAAKDDLLLQLGFDHCFSDFYSTIAWTPGIQRKAQDQFKQYKQEKKAIILSPTTFNEKIAQEMTKIRAGSSAFGLLSVKSIRDWYYVEKRVQQLLDEQTLIVISYEKELPIAYLVGKLDSNTLHIAEYFSLSPNSSDLIVILETIIEKTKLNQFSINFHTFSIDTIVHNWLKECGGSITINEKSEYMAMFLNPIPSLIRMQSTFSLRLAESPYRSSNLQIHLTIGEESCLFKIRNHLVSIKILSREQSVTMSKGAFDQTYFVKLTPRDFTVMMFGYTALENILPETYFKIPEKIKPYLEIFFPDLRPSWSPFDFF
jgi:hypothetical protein